VKLTYVNTGISGSRYTSWPIPLAVDGQVVRYAHVDVSGSKETSQTISFADLSPGDHEVKAGLLDLPATQGSVKITATLPPVQFVPPPVKTLASSETPGMEASHLFDGNLSPDSVGKATDLGGVYMSALNDNAHVIWTDYGQPIKANGLAFAQPPSPPSGANHTTTINLWFHPTDPGGGPVVPKVTKHGPDEVITLQWHNDSILRVYPFSHPRAGQFVVMQLVGHGASVGGSELRLIAP
jgi:hypothetical protein